MNFFNDIGRGFQDFGNTINNEVIKPATITLDPNQNGFTNTFHPNKTNFKMTFDPNKNGLKDVPKIITDVPKKIETQINKELNKISPTLNLPPPIPAPKNF